MDTKLGAALVIGLGVVWYVWRPGKTQAPDLPPQNTRKMQLQAVDLDKRQSARMMTDIKSIQKQRDIYRDQLALGVVPFRPKQNKNKWVFALDYAPIERRCVNGDIDLIQRHLPKDETLLWTWEAQGSQNPVFSREVAVKDLAEAFTQSLELPADSLPRYYRLALCLQTQGASCAKAEAVNYRNLENRELKITLKSALFFVQYFRVDDDGLQIFDSQFVKNVESYKKFAMKMDGNHSADGFLEEMVQQQKNLGSLPLEIKKDRVNVRLYVRTNKGC